MRLILVDNYSRCILGDTAGFAAGVGDWIAAIRDGIDAERLSLLAARLLDEQIGERDWIYEFSGERACEVSIGYLIYSPRSSALPLVDDESGPESLALLAEICDYVGFVRCEAAPKINAPWEARA
jgi:hypothetical protein